MGDVMFESRLQTVNESVVSGEGNPFLATDLFKGKDILRSDTPMTLMTDYTNKPDITVLCDKCNTYLDVRSLPYHRSYHEALEIFEYPLPNKPVDSEELLTRRNLVVRKKKAQYSTENPMRIQDVTKIDDAYELLKNDIEDTYEDGKRVFQKVDVDVRGVALNSSPACTYAVGMCSSENRRFKSVMEDLKVYQDYFGEDRNKCYLAIFDGHHGIQAAERAANELHYFLLNEMAKFDSKTKSTIANNFAESAAAHTNFELLREETKESLRVNLHQDSAEIVQNIMELCNDRYEEMMKTKLDTEDSPKKTSRKKKNPMTDKMHTAFKKTYYMMDILLSYGQEERSRVRWSGTSALTVVIQNTKTQTDDDKENKLASLEEESNGSDSRNRKRSLRNQQPKEPEEQGLIHIANAGDSHAVLVRDNKAYFLTKDHTPNNPKERKRVLKDGGNLSISEKDCRVNGVLSVTRGLGNHGDKKLKDCVIVDPYTTTVPIDQFAQFLVLASHGVWEVFSPDEVASLLSKMLPSQFIPAPRTANETLIPLLQSCLDKDNESVKSSESKGSRKRSLGLVKEKSHEDNNGFVFGSNSGLNNESTSEKEISDVSNLLPNEKETNVDIPDFGTKKVVTDLHTEIGSVHGSSTKDVSLHQDVNGDYLTMPNHSKVEEEEEDTTPEGRRRALARSMAETLTQAALLAGSKNNISVTVLLLPGCKV